MQDYAEPGSQLARHWVSPPVLQELERQRRVARARFLKTVLSVAAIAYGGGLGIFYAVAGSFHGDGLVGTVVAATFATLFTVALSQMYFSSYRKNFKTQVVSGLVQRADSGLRHQGDEGVTAADYDASLLFRNEGASSSFRSEDLTYGTAQGAGLRFSEAHSTRRYRSGGKDRTETIFRGVLGRVQMPRAVAGPLVLLPRERSRDQVLAGAPELLPFRLSDAAFDQAYAAYAAKPDDVRHLVTPEFRHALLANAKTNKRADLRVSLVHDGLFFSFAKNGDMLEPPWFTSLEKVDLSVLIEDVKGIVQLAVELSRRLSPGRASA